MENRKTAVEWLVSELYMFNEVPESVYKIINQAKEMENSRPQEYAEFVIRCDRMGMKILNFEDWMKL